MPESLRVDETLPMAPGTSPFHVRGVYYARVVEHAKSLPGGVSQLLDELVDARLRDFMRQQFHFMQWYDALPMVPCGAAGARIRGQSLDAFLRERSEASMLRLVPSMFRLFSRLGGPRLAASHAPRLFQSYFDFMELRILRISELAGSGVVTGVPLYAAPALLPLGIGLISGALQSLGAGAIKADNRELTVTGSRNGFEVVTWHSDFEWRLVHGSVRQGA